MVWIMMFTFAVYLGAHGLLVWKERAWRLQWPQWLSNPYLYVMIGLFILGVDFWAWGRVRPLFMGVPWWLGYFVALSGLQMIAMWFMMKKDYELSGTG